MFQESIKKFGAVPGRLCTTEIQSAIDACASSGGGEVIIEDVCYMTGTLFLRSLVTLVIRANAVLKASESGEDYPDFDTYWGKENAPRKTARCLIYAEDCEHIAILGGGTIDCSGSAFCEPYEDKSIRFWRRITDRLPARMIFFYCCRFAAVRDITLREMAGGWAYWINGCDFVTVDRINILCDPHYPNSDGVHINCCSDVTVSNSTINCGDDAIILRANNKTMKNKRSCCRVSVTNCTLSSQSNAVRIGWTNDGLIENCTFSNLVVTDSWYGISIEFPKKPEQPFTDQGDDFTEVRNLLFDNIILSRISTSPIQILAYPYNQVKAIEHIRFCGLTVDSRQLPIFRVEKGVRVSDITLSDCEFRVDDSAGLHFENIGRVNLQNVTVECRGTTE